jgi:hypothetical protein
MWEDKMNEKGGRWIIKFETRPRDVDINELWLDVVSMISDEFKGFEYRKLFQLIISLVVERKWWGHSVSKLPLFYLNDRFTINFRDIESVSRIKY